MTPCYPTASTENQAGRGLPERRGAPDRRVALPPYVRIPYWEIFRRAGELK
jgi:hypothetical protein